MAKQLKTRRDALREIVGTMAAAAALSTTQIEELLAQVKTVPDLARLRNVRASDNSVKALKILLAPKGQGARVFESEFGRRPALKPSLDSKTGRNYCASYLGLNASCADLGCALVVCNGYNVAGERLQAPNETSRVIATPGGEVAGFNSTGGCAYGYNKTEGCVGMYVPPTGGARTAKIQPDWLLANQRDPYIAGLMREFGVNRVEDLAVELEQVLAARRAGR